MEDAASSGPETLLGKTITCRVRIKRASGLPEKLSNFVFCQYSFFNISELLVVAPANESTNHSSLATTVIFEHQRVTQTNQCTSVTCITGFQCDGH